MRMLVILAMAAISLTALPGTLHAQNNGPSADDLNGRSPPAPANTTIMRSPDPAMPDAVITNYPGNMVTTPPMDMNKSYPVCTAKLQDNCQNRGEGGAPGRSRALQHWPGQPASEQ